MKTKPKSIIVAPLVSEQYFSGVSLMAESLIEARIAKALKAKITTTLSRVGWFPERDPQTKILNPWEVRNYSIDLAKAIETDFNSGYFPVVLGGDCTILIGAMLAARRNGNSGLFFIDGDADFYDPGVSPSGETADMELGLVTGNGPEILTEFDGIKPLVAEENTVLFGYRDEAMVKRAGGRDVRSSNIRCVSLDDTRYYGFNNKLEEAIRTLKNRVDNFWIHLDFDVLNDSLMPAVDYRMPDGFSAGELVNTLQRLIQSGKASGISVSIFNPTLDYDGSLAEQAVDYLRAGLTESLF